MARPYCQRKLTNKEKFDQRTMLYFLPKGRFPGRVQHNDRVKMADLSSRGIQPKNITNGFQNLLWGKTYRDEQITSWKRDISLGYFTKIEIYESVPTWLRLWAESKLKDVPYDVDGETSRMLVRMYHNG